MTFCVKSHWMEKTNKQHKNKYKKRSNVTKKRELERWCKKKLLVFSISHSNEYFLIYSLDIPSGIILAKDPRASGVFDTSPSTEAISSYSRGSWSQRARASSTSARLAAAVPPGDMMVAASADSSGIIDSESLNDIIQMASLPPSLPNGFSLKSLQDAIRYFERKPQSVTSTLALNAHGLGMIWRPCAFGKSNKKG